MKARNLSTGGVKAELVTRLEDAMAAGDGASAHPASIDEQEAGAAADAAGEPANDVSPEAAAAAAAAPSKAARNMIVFAGSAADKGPVAGTASKAAPIAAAPAVAAAPEPVVPEEPELPSKHPKIKFNSEVRTHGAPKQATSCHNPGLYTRDHLGFIHSMFQPTRM